MAKKSLEMCTKQGKLPLACHLSQCVDKNGRSGLSTEFHIAFG